MNRVKLTEIPSPKADLRNLRTPGLKSGSVMSDGEASAFLENFPPGQVGAAPVGSRRAAQEVEDAGAAVVAARATLVHGLVLEVVCRRHHLSRRGIHGRRFLASAGAGEAVGCGEERGLHSAAVRQLEAKAEAQSAKAKQRASWMECTWDGEAQGCSTRGYKEGLRGRGPPSVSLAPD